MKKLLILLFTFLTLSLSGQIYPGVISSQGVSGGGCPEATYTDDFEEYTHDEALGGQGNWVDVISGNRSYLWTANHIVYAQGVGNHISLYNDDFCDDQYAEIVTVLVGASMGVGVRLSGTGATADGYIYVCANGASFLSRIDDGEETVLAEGTAALNTDDVIRLEIEGSELRCYINGSLDTTISDDGKYTDDTYSSGKAGVAVRNNAATFGDTWEGGNL